MKELLTAIGAGPRVIMREKETPAAELGLTDTQVSDDTIIDAIVRHPLLVNRPIVVTLRGTKLCRPSEAVLDLMDRKLGSFTNEDGRSCGLGFSSAIKSTGTKVWPGWMLS